MIVYVVTCLGPFSIVKHVHVFTSLAEAKKAGAQWLRLPLDIQWCNHTELTDTVFASTKDGCCSIISERAVMA